MTIGFQQQIYDFLMESQYFSTEDMHHQHMHQLEALIRFARAQVPFYRTRLNCIFNSRDEFDFRRWSEVPILTRKDLLNHNGTMLATNLPPGHGEVHASTGSGSTGKPVESRHNQLLTLASQASAFRSFAWHSVDYSRNFFSWFGGGPNVARAPTGWKGGPWGPPWNPASAKGKSTAMHHVDPPEAALAFMQQNEAYYVDGRSHSLQDLAAEALKQRVSHPLGALYSFSTKLNAATRELCKEAFGAPVVDRYASKEVADIAYQCPSCNNLHVNWELMLLEVLDEDGAPCPIGKMGRIIVTPFYSTAQPFIRYDLGDYATMGPPCSCGREMPVITEINGRTIHAFILPDGRKVVPSIFGFVRQTLGTAEWQIAQTAPEVVELRYVKVCEVEQVAYDKLSEVIRSQLTLKTKVIYREMRALPATPSGKILESVCELPPEAAP